MRSRQFGNGQRGFGPARPTMPPLTKLLIAINILFFALCLNPFDAFTFVSQQRLIAQALPPAIREATLENLHQQATAARILPSGLLGENLAGTIGYWGTGQAKLTFENRQWWRLLTSIFLHANGMHIFFNMFVLWSFGPVLERILGSWRYLVFYLLCGLGGSLCSDLMGLVPFYRDLWVAPGVGASGAIYGVLLGLAIIAPQIQLQTMWGSTVSMRAYALIMLGIGLVTILSRGQNFGGELAHLGGALVGAALAANPRLLAWLPGPYTDFVNQRKRQRGQRLVDAKVVRETKIPPERINQILEKASAHGIASLDPQERADLENFRRQME